MTEEFTRPDGRSQKDLRDIKIEVGVLDRAEGSARVYLGKNIALATVYGPREMHPKHAALPDRAQMRINYRMATFSVDGYKRSYPSRREKEISKVLSEAFESVVILKNWPRSVVDVHVQLLQSDGGTRTAAGVAISAALADAGLPMRDLPASIATGLYEEKVCLDLTGHEDMKGTGDMPLMYAPSIDEVSLFQLDGQFTFEQFKDAFDTSIEAITKISELIRRAVKEKYLLVRDQYIDDEEEIDEELLDDDDEEEYEEEDEEDTDEGEEEITPVSAPVGETHAIASSGTSEEDQAAAELVEETPEPTSTETPATQVQESPSIPPAPTPQDEIEETPATEDVEAETVEESDETSVTPASQMQSSSDVSSVSTDEVSNRWFTKRGGKLKPMSGKDETGEVSSDEAVDEESEEEADDNSEETSGIMRDLEYSFDEEE